MQLCKSLVLFIHIFILSNTQTILISPFDKRKYLLQLVYSNQGSDIASRYVLQSLLI